MLQKKILVVDDAYVRALVVKILNGSGYLAIPAVDAWWRWISWGSRTST